MKYELKNINIISEDYGSAAEDFWVSIRIEVSEKGKDEKILFQANVVGSVRIDHLIAGKETINNSGLFIAHIYDPELIHSILTRILSKINAKTEEQLIKEFSRFVIYEGPIPT